VFRADLSVLGGQVASSRSSTPKRHVHVDSLSPTTWFALSRILEPQLICNLFARSSSLHSSSSYVQNQEVSQDMKKRILGATLLSISMLAVVMTVATVPLANASTWRGSYLQTYWENGKKVMEIYIVKADLTASGYTRTMTLVTLLQVTHFILDPGLVAAFKFAIPKVLASQVQDKDGSVKITVLQISGNWVYAYYGFWPRVFPMPPFTPLYVSGFANYPCPHYEQLKY
jgi:hypothetical protein